MEVEFEGELLTLKEAAKLLNCSHETVRKRILTGKMEGVKVTRNNQEQWMVPLAEIKKNAYVQEVVPINQPISPTELQTLLQVAMQEVVKPLVEEQDELKKTIEFLADKVQEQQGIINGLVTKLDEHHQSLAEGVAKGLDGVVDQQKERDVQLVNEFRSMMEDRQKKGLLSKIFG